MRHRSVIACYALLVSATCAWGWEAGPCGASGPAVNKRGFRPYATVAYQTATSPDGTPFPEGMRSCVDRAFEAWTRANQRAKTWIRFAPGTGGILVRFDSHHDPVLRPQRAGAWTSPLRSSDGYLEGATIWITRDPALVTRCDTVTKVVLHELGHLHGMADARAGQGATVMNPLGGRDDVDRRVSPLPSRCDGMRAAAAAFAPARPRVADRPDDPLDPW